eukprot:g3192.t1
MGAASSIISKPLDVSDITDLDAAKACIIDMRKAATSSGEEAALAALNDGPLDGSDITELEYAKAEIARLRSLAPSLETAPASDPVTLQVAGNDITFTNELDLMTIKDEEGVEGGLFKLGVQSLSSFPDGVFSATSITILNIRHCGINVIPKDIAQLEFLSELNCSENGLQELPAELGQLKRLKSIDCSDNSLTKLPEEIGGCVALHTLVAFKNKLASLPSSLAKCTQLKEVNFFNNALKTIPMEFQELTQLEDVNLGSNKKLKFIPPTRKWTKLKRLALQWCGLNDTFWSMKSEMSFETLTNLEMLQMDRNTGLTQLPTMTEMKNMQSLVLPGMKALASLPESLASAQGLTSIDASSCALTSIPSGIGKCSKLQIAKFGSNKLTELPDELGNCSALETLMIEGNESLSKLPKSLCSLTKLTRVNFRGCKLDLSDPDTKAVTDQFANQCGDKYMS